MSYVRVSMHPIGYVYNLLVKDLELILAHPPMTKKDSMTLRRSIIFVFLEFYLFDQQ